MMDWTEEPTLKEFAECFQDCLDDTGCMSSPEGWIASHKIKGGIRIELEGDEAEFEIVGLDMDQLMGCGCSSGLTIRVKKVVDL